MVKIIGIGEWAVSNNENEVIKTYALGSCVALTAYCPLRKAAGMVHIALPSLARAALAEKVPGPGYYAASAVPLLINELCNKYGCPPKHLIIELFGGANSVREKDVFQIGCKNIAAVKNALTALDLTCASWEIGGTASRTVQIEVATGKTSVTLNRIII